MRPIRNPGLPVPTETKRELECIAEWIALVELNTTTMGRFRTESE